MKLVTFLTLLCISTEPAVAQQIDQREPITERMNEKIHMLRAQHGNHAQTAYAGLGNDSMIEMRTVALQNTFMDTQDPRNDEKKKRYSVAAILDDWQERVFKSLRMYAAPHQYDLVNDSRLLSKGDLNGARQNGRIVSKIVLRETLRFTQERIPEIDRVVKVLKLEFSTNMATRKQSETNDDDTKIREATSRRPADNDRIFIKTGLQLPLESGRVSLVSETEARFGRVSSLIVIYLNDYFDNNIGFLYVWNSRLQLKVERRIAHSTQANSNESGHYTSSLNFIQMSCFF